MSDCQAQWKVLLCAIIHTPPAAQPMNPQSKVTCSSGSSVCLSQDVPAWPEKTEFDLQNSVGIQAKHHK